MKIPSTTLNKLIVIYWTTSPFLNTAKYILLTFKTFFSRGHHPTFRYYTYSSIGPPWVGFAETLSTI